MNYCLFLLGHLRDSTEDTAAAAAAEIGALLPALRGVPGLSALAHHRRAAVGVQDPRIAEAAGPDRAIQLFFRELLCLESALSEDGLLQRCIGTRSRQPLAWRLQAMAARREVKIMFNTFVTEIHRDHLVIDASGRKGSMPNNFIFIFAGAEMPFKFLQSLGIKIDKKFGEARKTP